MFGLNSVNNGAFSGFPQNFSQNRDLLNAAKSGDILEVRCLLLLKILPNAIDVNARDEDGSTPLIHASREGHFEVVELLLAADGIDINAEDENEVTALIFASAYGHQLIVELLLRAGGPTVTAKDDYGNTALLAASRNGHLGNVKRLLAADGIDVNITDEEGRTSLIYASKEGHLDIVEYLLTVEGIDVNAKDEDGMTGLCYASEDSPEMVKAFLAHPNANRGDFLILASQGDTLAVKNYLMAGTPYWFMKISTEDEEEPTKALLLLGLTPLEACNCLNNYQSNQFVEIIDEEVIKILDEYPADFSIE